MEQKIGVWDIVRLLYNCYLEIEENINSRIFKPHQKQFKTF